MAQTTLFKPRAQQYYKKDKKVRLARKVGDGWRYLLAGSQWAYSRQLSQEQQAVAGQIGTKETRLFVIGYKAGLRPYDWVSYRGAWYQVTRVDTQDDYRGEMYLYVREAPKGDRPRDVAEPGE